MSWILCLAWPHDPGYLDINMDNRDKPLLVLTVKIVLMIDGAEQLMLLLVSVLFKLVSITKDRQ